MIKKNLTRVILLLLAVANIAAAVLTVAAHNGKYEYDENAVSELSGLMDGIGIGVSDGLFGTKRTDILVYSGSCSDTELKRAANVVAPDGLVTDDGTSVSVLTQDGRYTFGRKFEFDFKSNTVADIDRTAFNVIHNDAILTRRLLRTVRKFFHLTSLFTSGVNSDSAVGCSTEITSVFSDADGNYAVELSILFDGLPTDNTVYIVISDNGVVYANGKLPTVLPTEKYSAELYDKISIVTEEYRRLCGTVTERKTLTALTVGYDMSVDAFGDIYYMPVCTVGYSDGETAVYDLIQCKKL